jgi:hypothetical protein
MQRKVAALTAGAAVFVPLLAYGWMKAEATAPIEEEIRGLEEQRRQAVLHNDTKALDSFYATGMTTVDIAGILHTNSNKQAVSLNVEGTRTVKSWVADEMRVRVYGGTAGVTQRAEIEDAIRDESRRFSARLTHVWVRLDGHWQLVARQATRIADQS